MAALRADASAIQAAIDDSREAREAERSRQAAEEAAAQVQAPAAEVTASPQVAPSQPQVATPTMAPTQLDAIEVKDLNEVLAPALAPAREIRDMPVAAIDVGQVAARDQQDQQRAASMPSGMDAISSLFGAPSGAQARSSAEPNATFTSLGDGKVSFTNQYGYTRTLDAQDYSHPTRGRDQKAASPISRQSGLSRKDDGGFLGGLAGKMPSGKEIAGALIGTALGAAVAGPAGAAIGGKVGSSRLGTGIIDSLFGGLFGGGFPEAPASPPGGDATSFDRDRAESISPGALDAIDRGSGGLY